MVIEGYNLVFSEEIHGKLFEIYDSEDDVRYTYCKRTVEVYIDHVLYLKQNDVDILGIIKNIKLIPESAIMITAQETKNYACKLLAGTLVDSHCVVYAFALIGGGLTGYSCNFFWIPTKAELDTFIIEVKNEDSK